MSYYTGIPRNRPRNAARVGNNLVRCAICLTVRDYRSRMVYQQLDVPGWPTRRVLVHPECKDQPQPRAQRPRPRPMKPPDVQQPFSTDYTTTDIGGSTHPAVATPTLTTAVWAVTGTTSASLAQVTGDPTVTCVGTGFSAKVEGRANAASTYPELRDTTYVSATSCGFEVRGADIAVGTLIVDVYNVPPQWSDDGVQNSNNITLTTTA